MRDDSRWRRERRTGNGGAWQVSDRLDLRQLYRGTITGAALPSARFHRILDPMSRSLLPEAVERYVTQDITPETDIQRRLRAETGRLKEAGMQIGADQGALLALLTRAIGTRIAIEIGLTRWGNCAFI